MLPGHRESVRFHCKRPLGGQTTQSGREREAFAIWKGQRQQMEQIAGDAEELGQTIRRFIESTCDQSEIPQAFGDIGWSLPGLLFLQMTWAKSTDGAKPPLKCWDGNAIILIE